MWMQVLSIVAALGLAYALLCLRSLIARHGRSSSRGCRAYLVSFGEGRENLPPDADGAAQLPREIEMPSVSALRAETASAALASASARGPLPSLGEDDSYGRSRQ